MIDESGGSMEPMEEVPFIRLEGKYSLESTDPRESEIRAPPQPLPYLMPIPPTRFFTTKKLSQPFCR